MNQKGKLHYYIIQVSVLKIKLVTTGQTKNCGQISLLS